MHDHALRVGAVLQLRCILCEPNVGTVVERVARLAAGDDLQRRKRAVLDVVQRHGELLDAKGAAAGDVEELWREGDVEVCGVCAEAEVDIDVGPGVMELEGEGAAADGPVGDVACFVGDAAAWDSVSEIYFNVC